VQQAQAGNVLVPPVSCDIPPIEPRHPRSPGSGEA
jgi:hypothetical protein